MAKFYYPPLRQFSFLLVLAFVMTALSTTFVLAQQTKQYQEGILRIKVSESLATELDRASLKRTSGDVVLTGIQSIDNVNQRYKVRTFKRVFPAAGRYEAKHRRYGLHQWFEIEVDGNTSVPEVLSAYKALERVELSEPVYKKAIIGSGSPRYGPVVVNPQSVSTQATLPGASNDPLLGAQWHYNNTGQTGGTPGADIKLLQAWGIETGNSQVIVAVTDGGIQVNHPDLAANIWVNTDEIPGNNIDDDNNGYVDDINGYGFGDNTGTIAPDAHGTHVGGTIAAVTNNGVGVAGVAGGSGTGDGVRLMSCAAFGATANGGFEDTYIYAADNGALISQNSWGYTFPNVFEQAVLDAIDYFRAEAGKDENGNQVGLMNGGIVIFAAGNDDDNGNWYPGFYANTLAVAGTNHKDQKAWYSNYGTWVDVAAPGGETSGVPAQQGVLSTLSNNQYGYFQGTSMACPHVSGLAALLVSKYGGTGLTPVALRARILDTTDDIDAVNPTFPGLLGVGRINAFKALQEDDGEAPAAIIDLSVATVGITSVTLTWTSPTDEGSGSATTYDIRYSTSPITAANFNLATPVANPPAPKPAGTVEAFTVTGLTPGTTYYFAIRSADFFGNTSALSNVASETTNFAPSIVVSPDTITATLQTAQTTTRPLTIANSGQGPLTFVFAGVEDFATVSPDSGTVAAGSSLTVTVAIDASGLLAGTYTQSLKLLSNDPLRDTMDIPVILTVTNNGAPIASVDPASLDFGEVFEGGSKSLPVTVHNAGSDTLRINSLTVTPNSFSVTASSLTVAPFADATLTVTYTASSLGAVSGTLEVATNDPADTVLTVSLTAEGIAAPHIVISPDSLAETLNTGDSTTRVLTVSNTGSNTLEYSIKVSSGVSSVSVVKEVPVASSNNGASVYTTGQKQVRNPLIKAKASVRLKSVAVSAVTSKVLVLTPDNDVSDISDILDGFDDIEVDVFPEASLPGITLADLDGYDVVFVTNNTQWVQGGAVDPVIIGDLLADYVDAGGKVIVNQFAYSYDAWKLSGRFITEQYGPFTPATTDSETSTTLGTILSPGHPILDGVRELDYTGFVQNVGLAPGAEALANWANGQLFLAVNSNVVALNFLPSLGNGDPLQWEGDLPTLYQNAVHWLSGPSFVKVNPTEGTVAPGGQASVSVLFDATGLTGGVYRASIDFLTNVPGDELVSVPATLTVLGPAFTVTPDSLYEELEQGETSTKTLVLKNNGTGDYDYAITVINKGVSSIFAKRIPAVTKTSAERIEPVKRTSAFNGQADILSSRLILSANAGSLRTASVGQTAATLYETDFEDFALGDVSGQDGWAGQFGNWTIEAENASSGTKHLRGLADGLGQSLAFSPTVAIGSDPKSTATMRLNLQGTGVTWQIIPQSPTAQFVNTRVSFAANGSVQALVSDGAGGASYVTIPATVPSGYFDLTIEVDRATAVYDIYFNSNKVFTGQGFAGDIEQVVVLSLMEEEGPTLDLDDLKILDGTNEFTPPYLTVSPLAGHLSAGESVEITVGFDARELSFGTYRSDLKIDVANGIETLLVPTVLAVVGDVALEIDQTVLQATVGYKEDTVKHFSIKNTGGGVLNYSLQVIGADTDAKKLIASPVSKFGTAAEQKRIEQKTSKDKAPEKGPAAKQSNVLQLLAGTSIFEERFEGSAFPPTGWSVVDHEGEGVVWGFADAFGEGNYAGTGEAATASSDAVGQAEFDTELLTPYISTAGYSNVALQFNANYQNYAALDFLDLDIRVQGDTAWSNILHWNEDHGTLRGTGQTVTVELDEYLDDATSFQLRWHYYDPNTGDYDWYAQIDNVVVLGDAQAWLTVSPASGSVPVRGSVDVTARFDSKDLESGFYVAGVLVSSNAVKNPLVGIVASLDVQDPAVIHVTPESLTETVVSGLTETQILTISNSGESLLRFSFEGVATPGPSDVSKERIIGEKRTTPTESGLKPDDTKAIVPTHTEQLKATELYATSFEEFSPGDVNAQEGWQGQFGNWTIESESPFLGAQHLRGLADGLGQSLAFSPRVSIGQDSISSTTLKLNADEGAGVTWQVIPQSPTAQFVNTRIQISPDGSLSALVQDSSGTGGFVSIDATLPEGYFELRIDVVRATSVFTIYIDGASVFTGQGFAGDIEQVVLLSLMEANGPFLDIDNVAILDGAPQAPWLLVSPLSGTVARGASLPVTVTFDARELSGGVYFDTLSLLSNDPIHTLTSIPVTLNVVPPPVIEVSPDSLHQALYAGETASQSLTIRNTGVAPLQYAFLGYASDSTQRNNVSKIYPDTYVVEKGQADLRKGHPVTFGLGGPDKNGYTWIDSHEAQGPAFVWNDISSYGTALVLEDDDSISVNLPFAFSFYGSVKTRVTVSSNGYLVFGSNGADYSNDEIPNVASPNNYIAPFWDDLNPEAANASVYYYGDSSRFVVQYSAPGYLSTAANTFQVVLFPDGSIRYYYLNVDETRNSATIGIENPNGSDGLLVAFNTPYVTDSLAVTIASVPQWISPQPVSGTVAGGSSASVTVAFNADGLLAGEYKGSLFISSNDLKTPLVSVPVSLTVIDNYAPVLGVVRDTTVVAGGSLKLTFTATDVDDSVISVRLKNAPSFVSTVSEGNGTSTYLVKPSIGQSGDYDIVVIAQDGRGRTDSATFRLKVLPYGVASFSLVDATTGGLVYNFKDTLLFDVADPALLKYTIRANTNPLSVGSVQFSIDGKVKNTDNQAPYLVNRFDLALLSEGPHVLKATAFTKSGAKGTKGQSKTVVINVLNSATITRFDVVNVAGNVLSELRDGSVINLKTPGYKHITVKANTTGTGVGSVRFDLNGKFYRMDNLAPFSLTGDLFGYYLPWNVSPGHYTLVVTPYSLPFGLGIPGTPVTIAFDVINSNSPAGKGIAQGRVSNESSILDGELEERSFSVYPVPVKDQLNLKLRGVAPEESADVVIHTIQGQVVYKVTVPVEVLSDYTINTNDIGLIRGVYYLQIKGTNGLLETRRFIKE